MQWLNEIEEEMHRIVENANPGRTRTIARRIAGIALRRYYNHPAEDVLRIMQTALNDASIPLDVRSAVERLAARLDAQFKSPSVDPIADATIVVDFIKKTCR